MGLGIAATAFFARAGLVAFRRYKNPSGFNSLGKAFYKGGFEQKMTKREAQLILEIKDRSGGDVAREKLRKRHREMMLLNHPDRGGSPYLAGKINEAKELLDRGG
jgi:DnaJ homolog subfamily C member 19